MEGHVKAVGLIFIVLGFLEAGAGILCFVLMAGIGTVSGDRTAAFTMGAIGIVIAFVLVIIAIPGLVAGFGLLQRKNWARVLCIVIAALHIFGFPIGTAIAVYTLWVLLNDETARMFAAPVAMRPAV